MEAWHLYHEGFQWELSSDDIDRLANKTERFEEVCSEYELIEKFMEVSDQIFMSATDVKNKLETLTVQKLNLKRIGMFLKKKYKRVVKNKMYGYMIQEKNSFQAPSIISQDNPNPF